MVRSDQLQMMELEDLLSDLHALKKLYGLLHTKTTDIPQSSPSINLDDKSKLLLKRLLDGATEQAFQSHAKIIAEQSATSSTNHIISSTQLPPEASTDQLPSKLHDSTATISSPKKSQSNTFSASSNCSSSKYLLLNCDSMNSRSKKRCKICGKSTVKRSNSTKDNNIVVTSIDNTVQVHAKNSESINGHIKESSESKEKTKENDQMIDTHEQFDHQMKNPIQKAQKSLLQGGTESDKTELPQSTQKEKNKLQPSDQKPLQDRTQSGKTELTQSTAKKEKSELLHIEIDQNSVPNNTGKEKKDGSTHILSLTREKDEFPSRLTSQKDGKNKMTNSSGRVLSQTGKLVPVGNELVLSETSQKDGKGRKPKQSSTRNSDSVSEITSQILPPKMPPSHGKKIVAPSAPPVQTKSMGLTPPRFDSVGRGSRIKREPTIHIARNRSTNKAKGGSKRGAKMEKAEPYQMVILPTLLDHPLRGSKMKPIQKEHQTQRQQRRESRKSIQVGPWKRNPPCRQMVEESLASSSGSPSWTSQECISESEVNSMPRSILIQQHHIGAPLQRESSYLSFRSEGKRRTQSPRGRSRRRHVDTHTSTHQARPTQMGRLRRFKNKLGLIFHHHHHHHHHHHANDDDHHDSSDQDQTGHDSALTTTNQDHSLWRYVRKMLHCRSKDADVEGRVVGGTRRGVHRQQGHLRALVDGLFRNVWHSRPIERIGKSKKKKVVKKWHWWQRFYKKSGRRSSSKKVLRSRAGFNGRKHQLPAAKKRP